MEERLGLGYYLAYFGNGLERQNISGYFAPTVNLMIKQQTFFFRSGNKCNA